MRKAKVRILYVGGFNASQRGAIGTHTAGVIEAFSVHPDVDLEGIFLSSQVPDFLPVKYYTTGIDIGKSYVSKALVRARYAIKVRSLVRTGSYDYIYSRFDPFFTPFIGLRRAIVEYNDDFLEQIARAVSGGGWTPIGRRVRSSILYRYLIKQLEKVTFSRSFMVVSVTRQLSEACRKVSPRCNAITVLNGSKAGLYRHSAKGSGDSRLVLGHIGTLTYWDGLLELLDALSEFRVRYPEKDVHLLIVGDGVLLGAIVEKVRDLGLGDAVTIRPSVSRAEAINILGSVDVVPLLKTIAGYGLSPIKYYEALAAGKTVIVTDIEHINEVPKEYGIIVDYPLVRDQVVEVISNLHDNLGVIRARSQEISSYALAHHSWNARIAQILSVIVRPTRGDENLLDGG